MISTDTSDKIHRTNFHSLITQVTIHPVSLFVTIMVAAEVMVGAVGCLLCSVFSLFCVVTQMENRNPRGRSRALCCGGDEELRGELFRQDQLEELEMEQNDRANRMGTFFLRQRAAAVAAAQNVPRPTVAVVQQPAAVITTAVAPALEVRRMPMWRPVLMYPAHIRDPGQNIYQSMALVSPYQMSIQAPCPAAPILFYP